MNTSGLWRDGYDRLREFNRDRVTRHNPPIAACLASQEGAGASPIAKPPLCSPTPSRSQHRSHHFRGGPCVACASSFVALPVNARSVCGATRRDERRTVYAREAIVVGWRSWRGRIDQEGYRL